MPLWLAQWHCHRQHRLLHSAFAKNQGIESMNEVYPLEKAQEACDQMMSGKSRFRVVLKPWSITVSRHSLLFSSSRWVDV